MDYRDVELPYVVLDPGALERDWDRTVVAALDPLDARLVGLADAFKVMLGDDNVQLAQFSIGAAPAIAWVLRRNRWIEFGMLDRLFAHPAVQAALPSLQGSDARVGGFAEYGAFTSLGQLADRIREAGPYVDFSGSDAYALDLALNFMSGVCDLRFSETIAFVTRDAWTDWFFGVGPDASFLWFDKRSGIATALLLTGAD